MSDDVYFLQFNHHTVDIYVIIIVIHKQNMYNFTFHLQIKSEKLIICIHNS